MCHDRVVHEHVFFFQLANDVYLPGYVNLLGFGAPGVEQWHHVTKQSCPQRRDAVRPKALNTSIQSPLGNWVDTRSGVILGGLPS